jgi:hypothetical protein
MNTHVVLSTQYQNTRVARPSEQSRSVTDAAGWSNPSVTTRTAKPKSAPKSTRSR